MNPKDGLRDYLKQDIDDILDALVDDRGNVGSQIMLNLNGRNRPVNVGLIKYMVEWIYNRPNKRSIQDVVADICECAFVDYTPQRDTLDGVPLPRRLVGVGAKKSGAKFVVSARYRSCINGKVFGPPHDVHYYNDNLTKFQQVYIMHLLLALGEGGHAGQGLADWDFYAEPEEDIVKFTQVL